MASIISSDSVYTISRVDNGYIAQVKITRKGLTTNVCLDNTTGRATLFSVRPVSTVEQAEQLISIHKNEGTTVSEDNDLIPYEGDNGTKTSVAAEKPRKKKTKKGKDKTPDKTPAKKQASSDKKPGVIACMIEMLRAADADNPVTKATMLKVLVERFPDRTETAMKSTLNMQVPSGLRTEKGLEVSITATDDGKGYWLEADQLTKKERAEQEAAAPAKKQTEGKKKSKGKKVKASGDGPESLKKLFRVGK
jgi:hypothetical protein